MMLMEIIKVPSEKTVLNMTVTPDMLFHNQEDDKLYKPDVPVLEGMGLATSTLGRLIAIGTFYEIGKIAP